MGDAKLKVKLSTYKSELAFESQSRLSAKELFTQVCKHLGVHEYWYFGINYVDEDHEEIWIDASKKVLKVYENVLQKLQYHVKYMPIDVIDLIEDNTVNYFYLQLRNSILHGRIYCPAETCALLASYNCQIRHGDYSEDVKLETERLLPEKIYKQHTMDAETWREQIAKLWHKHKGMIKEDAMMEYLKIVQDLDMFGVHYFEIENKKGTNLMLGIQPRGLNIYNKDDKINPKIMFPWSEIKSLTFQGRKFVIRTLDAKGTDFIFTVAVPKLCKRILTLGIGYHQMYVSRSRDDRPELPQLRENALQRKQARREQREKLLREVQAREEAERERVEQRQTIKRLERQLADCMEQLKAANSTIAELQHRLQEQNRAKESLEQQERELREMMRQLESAKDLEAAERERLQNEISEKQDEVQRYQDEVDRKNAEAEELQAQVEEARRAQEALEQRQLEEQQLRQAEVEERERREAERREEERLRAEEAERNHFDEEPRLASINQQLQTDLARLQMELDQSRISTQDTDLDRIHRENLARGNDKYKTLKNIRQGNTVRRVDMFENM